MKKILFDLDGVLADLVTAMLYYTNTALTSEGVYYNYTSSDVTDYSFSSLDPYYRKRMFELWGTDVENIYALVEPNSKILDVYAYLNTLPTYRLGVHSLVQSQREATCKTKWLHSNLDAYRVTYQVCSSDGEKIPKPCHIIVEDCVSNLVAYKAFENKNNIRIHKLLLDSPWNHTTQQDLDACDRCGILRVTPDTLVPIIEKLL